MGWLTGRNSADDGIRSPSTISDDEWRNLQRRAGAHAPKLGSAESARRQAAAKQQYRNRKNN
jgi:hypothetical protein